jgi:hypothetical protein
MKTIGFAECTATPLEYFTFSPWFVSLVQYFIN